MGCLGGSYGVGDRGLGASVAEAAGSGVSFTATVNGQPVVTSSDAHPAQLYPARFAEVQITLLNNSTSTVSVSSVRIDGQVVVFPSSPMTPRWSWSYLPVRRSRSASHQHERCREPTTGLIVGSISLLGSNGATIASQPLVTKCTAR